MIIGIPVSEVWFKRDPDKRAQRRHHSRAAARSLAEISGQYGEIPFELSDDFKAGGRKR